MIPYAPLTRRQAAYVLRARDCWLNVAEGGKRAGKNVISLIAWAATLEGHPDRLHLAAGASQSAAKINIFDSDGFGLEHIFAGRCRMGLYKGREAMYIRTADGREQIVLVAGGLDAGSAKTIKGHSYGSIYITEVNECHPVFVKEAMDRTLASERRRVFFDLNPKPPSHWFYEEILDYQDALAKKGENEDYNYAHFTIADNLSVSDEKMAKVLATYDKGSIWYQRDIAGLRTAASGRIYTAYDYEQVAVTREWIAKQQYAEVAVGIDIGSTAATCATLTGFTKGYEQAVMMDGLYHAQGRENRMEHSDYADRIVAWLEPWAEKYPVIGTVYADSADKFFRATLQRRIDEAGFGRRLVVRATDKGDGIVARIDLQHALMKNGRLKVAAHMRKWHEAYQMATWDAREYEKREWVRLDDGSYPVDCLDSGEYTTQPYRRLMAV